MPPNTRRATRDITIFCGRRTAGAAWRAPRVGSGATGAACANLGRATRARHHWLLLVFFCQPILFCSASLVLCNSLPTVSDAAPCCSVLRPLRSLWTHLGLEVFFGKSGAGGVFLLSLRLGLLALSQERNNGLRAKTCKKTMRKRVPPLPNL